MNARFQTGLAGLGSSKCGHPFTTRQPTNAFYIQSPRLQLRGLELAQRVPTLMREKQKPTISVIAVMYPDCTAALYIRGVGHFCRLLAT